jgi:hypothetical protein
VTLWLWNVANWKITPCLSENRHKSI